MTFTKIEKNKFFFEHDTLREREARKGKTFFPPDTVLPPKNAPIIIEKESDRILRIHRIYQEITFPRIKKRVQ